LRAEASRLQTRLRQINSSLEVRSRISDQIIDRRIKDLLNLDLQWDIGPPGQSSPLGPRVDSASKTAATAAPTRDLPKASTSTGRKNVAYLAALGLTVQELKREDASDPKYI